MWIVGLITEFLTMSLWLSVHSISKMMMRRTGKVQSKTCTWMVTLLAVGPLAVWVSTTILSHEANFCTNVMIMVTLMMARSRHHAFFEFLHAGVR